MSEEQITRFLPCKLDEDEVKAKAIDLATTITDLKDLEQNFKDLKDDMGAQIKIKEKEIETLAQIVKDKMETREVECYLRRVDDKLIMEVVRADTYEVVQTRPMTPEERQLVMFPTRPRLHEVDPAGEEKGPAESTEPEKGESTGEQPGTEEPTAKAPESEDVHSEMNASPDASSESPEPETHESEPEKPEEKTKSGTKRGSKKTTADKGSEKKTEEQTDPIPQEFDD